MSARTTYSASSAAPSRQYVAAAGDCRFAAIASYGKYSSSTPRAFPVAPAITRLHHPDDPAGGPVGVGDDGDVGLPDHSRAEGRIGDLNAPGRRTVVGKHDLTGEAAEADADQRAVEYGKVGGALQALALQRGQAGGEISIVEGGSERHLLDDRSLGASLLLHLPGSVLAVSLEQDSTQ